MTENDDMRRPDAETARREVLGRWEQRREPAPPYESVWRRIKATPSPLDRPRWGIGRCLRLAGALAWVQLRVVPWLVLPVALGSMAAAVLTARYLGAVQDASTANAGFASVVLFGAVVTVTSALSTVGPDAVSLATPLGPQAVVLARVTMVLAIDAAAAMLASALLAAWGVAGSFPAIVVGWLTPLALVAAFAVVATIWVAPWAGVVLGLVTIPLLGPHSTLGTAVGVGRLAEAIRDVATPAGVVVVGIAVLALAVASARRALLCRPAANPNQA